MEIDHVISRIQQYVHQNGRKPTMITMHPKDVHDIIMNNIDLFVGKTYSPPFMMTIMGIKVLRCVDLKEGEIILSTDLSENYNQF